MNPIDWFWKLFWGLVVLLVSLVQQLILAQWTALLSAVLRFVLDSATSAMVVLVKAPDNILRFCWAKILKRTEKVSETPHDLMKFALGHSKGSYSVISEYYRNMYAYPLHPEKGGKGKLPASGRERRQGSDGRPTAEGSGSSGTAQSVGQGKSSHPPGMPTEHQISPGEPAAVASTSTAEAVGESSEPVASTSGAQVKRRSKRVAQQQKIRDEASREELSRSESERPASPRQERLQERSFRVPRPLQQRPDIKFVRRDNYIKIYSGDLKIKCFSSFAAIHILRHVKGFKEELTSQFYAMPRRTPVGSVSMPEDRKFVIRQHITVSGKPFAEYTLTQNVGVNAREFTAQAVYISPLPQLMPDAPVVPSRSGRNCPFDIRIKKGGTDLYLIFYYNFNREQMFAREGSEVVFILWVRGAFPAPLDFHFRRSLVRPIPLPQSEERDFCRLASFTDLGDDREIERLRPEGDVAAYSDEDFRALTDAIIENTTLI